MLWICICFNADTDPALNLNANPDPDRWSQTSADTDPDKTLKSQKVFYIKNIVGNRSKNIPTKTKKAFLKGRLPDLFVKGTVS
jgi:hypothetical protein